MNRRKPFRPVVVNTLAVLGTILVVVGFVFVLIRFRPARPESFQPVAETPLSTPQDFEPAPGLQEPALPQPGLVAYYPFDGDARDRSGNGNHGIVYGAQFADDRFANPKHAYQFDGLESFMDLGTSRTLKMTDGLTISVWVRAETFDPMYQNIISDHADNELAVGPGKILRLYYNELQFHVGGVFGVDTAVYAAHVFDPSALGLWQHFVGTYDRHTASLFVNGRKVASVSFSEPLSVNENPLLVGSSGFGEFFRGGIDDLLIYNCAVPEDQIMKLYEGSIEEVGCETPP